MKFEEGRTGELQSEGDYNRNWNSLRKYDHPNQIMLKNY